MQIPRTYIVTLSFTSDASWDDVHAALSDALNLSDVATDVLMGRRTGTRPVRIPSMQILMSAEQLADVMSELALTPTPAEGENPSELIFWVSDITRTDLINLSLIDRMVNTAERRFAERWNAN